MTWFYFLEVFVSHKPNYGSYQALLFVAVSRPDWAVLFCVVAKKMSFLQLSHSADPLLRHKAASSGR